MEELAQVTSSSGDFQHHHYMHMHTQVSSSFIKEDYSWRRSSSLARLDSFPRDPTGVLLFLQGRASYPSGNLPATLFPYPVPTPRSSSFKCPPSTDRSSLMQSKLKIRSDFYETLTCLRRNRLWKWESLHHHCIQQFSGLCSN